MSCRAVGCTNRPSMQRSLQFFRFPSAEQDADRLRKWLVNMTRQDWKPTKSARLCSLHFEDHAFTTDSKGNRRLKNTAVPTVFALPEHPAKKPATRSARQRPMVSSDAEGGRSAASLSSSGAAGANEEEAEEGARVLQPASQSVGSDSREHGVATGQEQEQEQEQERTTACRRNTGRR